MTGEEIQDDVVQVGPGAGVEVLVAKGVVRSEAICAAENHPRRAPGMCPASACTSASPA